MSPFLTLRQIKFVGNVSQVVLLNDRTYPMKLQYYSDLHLETQPQRVIRPMHIKPDTDVIVFAGESWTATSSSATSSPSPSTNTVGFL